MIVQLGKHIFDTSEISNIEEIQPETSPHYNGQAFCFYFKVKLKNGSEIPFYINSKIRMQFVNNEVCYKTDFFTLYVKLDDVSLENIINGFPEVLTLQKEIEKVFKKLLNSWSEGFKIDIKKLD